MNRQLAFLHGGSLEITLTVPLSWKHIKWVHGFFETDFLCNPYRSWYALYYLKSSNLIFTRWKLDDFTILYFRNWCPKTGLKMFCRSLDRSAFLLTDKIEISQHFRNGKHICQGYPTSSPSVGGVVKGGLLGLSLPPLDQWILWISGGFQAPTGAEPPWKENKIYP